MKTLSTTSLTELITLIKNNFFRKSEGQEVSTLSIDSIPTSNSSNLVTSGGVYNAIPTALSQLSADSTHRLVSDTEKSTWNGKQNALGYTPYNATNPSGYQTAAQVSSAVASGVSGKQDTISDLATIRSGAASGATAYQKPSSGIPASDILSGAVSTLYTATLLANGWTVSSTYASQDVTVQGLLTTDRPIVDADISQGSGVSGKQAINEAFGLIYEAYTLENGIRVRVTEKPDIDIPIKILCIRK